MFIRIKRIQHITFKGYTKYAYIVATFFLNCWKSFITITPACIHGSAAITELRCRAVSRAYPNWFLFISVLSFLFSQCQICWSCLNNFVLLHFISISLGTWNVCYGFLFFGGLQLHNVKGDSHSGTVTFCEAELKSSFMLWSIFSHSNTVTSMLMHTLLQSSHRCYLCWSFLWLFI